MASVPYPLHPSVYKDECAKLCQFVYNWCAENKVSHTHFAYDQCAENKLNHTKHASYCIIRGDRAAAHVSLFASPMSVSRAYICLNTKTWQTAAVVTSANDLKERLDQILPHIKTKQLNEQPLRRSARLNKA
jgi:hypothetical protein